MSDYFSIRLKKIVYLEGIIVSDSINDMNLKDYIKFLQD